MRVFLLFWCTFHLLLQNGRGSPAMWSTDAVSMEDWLPGPSFLQHLQQDFKESMETNGGTDVCGHLQRVLNSSSQLSLSYDLSQQDNSLLNDNNLFWKWTTTTLEDMSVLSSFEADVEDEGLVLFASPLDGETPSLGNIFGISDRLFQNTRLLNITYNCTSKRLSVHINVSTPVEVLSDVVRFNGFVFSFSMVLGSQEPYETAVFSGQTYFLGFHAFMAVKFERETRNIQLKGIPTITTLSIDDALTKVKGDAMKIPPGIGGISNLILFGGTKGNTTTLGLQGRTSDRQMIVILKQKSESDSNFAVCADLCNIPLKNLIFTSNISGVPLFGDLSISKASFSSATGIITSSPILLKIFPTSSPLKVFYNGVHQGFTAFLTTTLAGVRVDGTLNNGRLVFNVSQTTPLQLSRFLSDKTGLGGIRSLPLVGSRITGGSISKLSFSSESSNLQLSVRLPHLLIIPNLMNLSDVSFNVVVQLQPTVTLTDFDMEGSWKFNSLNVKINVSYKTSRNMYTLTGSMLKDQQQLNINTLFKKVLGFDLPQALRSVTLSSMAGHLYSNSKYFIVMRATVSKGSVYLVLMKDSSGTMLGALAKVDNLKLSEIVMSSQGIDISEIAYFGKLSVSASLSVMSGPIERERLSAVLPVVFDDQFLPENRILPGGLSSQFSANISDVQNIRCTYTVEVVECVIPESIDISKLSANLPGYRSALENLPSPISGIMNAQLSSISYNTTSSLLLVEMSIGRYTVAQEFLSLSNVTVFYQGRLGSTVTTSTVTFKGIWHLLKYTVPTRIDYDAIRDTISISGFATGNFSIRDIVWRFTGQSIILPSPVKSFSLTEIRGRLDGEHVLVSFTGVMRGGRVACVFENSTKGTIGAFVAEVSEFYLSDLVELTSDEDISDVEYFGRLVIPRLRFAVATSDISGQILQKIAQIGSPLDIFRDGIRKGVTGMSEIKIGDKGQVALKFADSLLTFQVLEESQLSLSTFFSVIPGMQDIVDNTPSRLSSILNPNVEGFSLNPSSNELIINGSMTNTIELVPNLLSLTHIEVSLSVVLGTQRQLNEITMKGKVTLYNIPISLSVTYDGNNDSLRIMGQMNKQIQINDLLSSLSDNVPSIPSILSSAQLSQLNGSISDDNVIIALSGSISQGQIHVVYKKSSTQPAAVGIAVMKESLKFSSLVSSAMGIDITGVPYFGTLDISDIGLTISSQYMSSPLISSLFTSSSVLSEFGDSLDEGVTAIFQLTMAEERGIRARFVRGELDLEVPQGSSLSLNRLLTLLPYLEHSVSHLPKPLRDLASVAVESLEYRPKMNEIEFNGKVESVPIIPNILTLHNAEYSLIGTIGRNSSVRFASFKGKWTFSSLSLTTEVIYDNGRFEIEAESDISKVLSLSSIISSIATTRIPMISVLNSIEIQHILGKIENGVESIVFVGRMGRMANMSLTWIKSQSGEVLSLAVDVKSLKLSNLIQASTGRDISNIPFFGSLVIPSSSFIISSSNFSSLYLPDLNVPGIATELLLDPIPARVKGQLKLNVGRAVELIGEYSDHILSIKPPLSGRMSFADVVSVIPPLKKTVETLPQILQVLKKSLISSIVYNPNSGKLFLSLSLNSITIVPERIELEEVSVSLNTSISSNTGNTVLQQTDYRESYLYSMFEMRARVQALTVDELLIKGKWDIFGIKIVTSVKYDGRSKNVSLQGIPPINAKALSIGDLISNFSNTKLKLPDIQLLKLDKIRALSSSTDGSTTIVVSSIAGSSNTAHLIIQKTTSGIEIAVALSLEFTLVQLIKTVTSIDLSSVPFINSFEESTMVLTSSTSPIQTVLLRNVFEPDSPLRRYVGGIPHGVTASLKVTIGNCLKIEVTYINNVLNFTVPETCRVTLGDLLSEIPLIKPHINTLPPPLSDLMASDLKGIKFDPPTKVLSLNVILHKLNFSEVIVIQNLNISLSANLSKNGKLNSLSINGDLMLCDSRISTTVDYNQGEQRLYFSSSPSPDLTVPQLVSCLINDNEDIEVPSLSFLRGIKITNIVGEKVRNTFSLVLSSQVGRHIQVFLVYKKNVGEKPDLAVVASMEQFKLADVLNDAAGLDITSVPMLGSIILPWIGVSIASNDIATPLLNSQLSPSSPLKGIANNLPKGFTAVMDLSLQGGTLRGIYNNSVLSFVSHGTIVSLGSLLSKIPGVDLMATGVTTVFKDIADLRISGCVFDIEHMTMEVEVLFPRLNLFGKSLYVTDITITINVTFAKPVKLIIEARGKLVLGSRTYGVIIHQDQTTRKFVLTVNTEEFPIISLLDAVGGSLLPEDLKEVLGKVFNISILNATVQHPFHVTPKHMLISGMPQLFGLKTVHVTALLIEQDGITELIQKYTLPQLSISDMFASLFKINISSKILEEKAETSLIVSPLNLKGSSLSLPEFKDIDITEGISISLTIKMPSSCGGDLFCVVMKGILGNGTLILQGTYVNAKHYSVRAVVGDVILGGGVELKKAGLEYVTGAEPSVGLVGSIKLSMPPVTLNAAIRLTPSGVKLEGSMSGCWPNIFGISAITICNLYLTMTVSPTPPPISGLELGGRVEIGNRNCTGQNILTAEAYVGINVIDPTQSYFYADLSALTYQSLLDALCISVRLPKPLGDSGFPSGVKTSFSLLGKQLPHAGIAIPSGFRFKGTYSFLGLSATADIVIEGNRLKMYVELPAFNVGILKLYQSRNEKSKGPFLHIEVSRNSPPLINMSCFVEVLGISREGRLQISDSKYEFFVEGRIFSRFMASLRITSVYSKNIKGAAFEVEGQFKNDLFDAITQGVKNAFKKSADVADRHLSKAQGGLRHAQGRLDSAINKLERAKRKVDDAKRSFGEAIAKVENLRSELNEVCRIKTCERKCKRCSDGYVCCKKFLKLCVCTRVIWRRCCKKVKDVKCTIANTACYALKKPLDLALSGAIKFVEKCRSALDDVKRVFTRAQGALHDAKRGLKAAETALERVKDAYRTGVKAISKLVDFALTDIILIREIYFRVTLTSSASGEYLSRISGVILGADFNMNVRINIHNIWSAVRALAEQAIPGLGGFIAG